MLSYQDARYIVTEISRLSYYRETVATYQSELDALEQQKLDLSAPSSPNGREHIGEARGNLPKDYTQKLIDILEIEDRIKKEQFMYIWWMRKAENYYARLLEGDETEFVKAYFSTKDKRALAIKYCVGNPYDRIIRIVRAELQRK